MVPGMVHTLPLQVNIIVYACAYIPMTNHPYVYICVCCD